MGTAEGSSSPLGVGQSGQHHAFGDLFPVVHQHFRTFRQDVLVNARHFGQDIADVHEVTVGNDHACIRGQREFLADFLPENDT